MQLNNQKVTIADRGSTIDSWTVNGVSVFFPRSETTRQSLPVIRGGSPLCIPNFGIVKDMPEKYTLPRHGFIRDMKIKGEVDQPKSSGADTDTIVPEKIQYRSLYIHTANDMFNFNFSLRTEITLTKEGLSQHIFLYDGKKEKKRKYPLPVAPAFHPYFSTPQGEALIEIGGYQYSVSENDEEKEIRVRFKDLTSTWREKEKLIRIRLPGLGIVVMRLGEGFSTSPFGGLNIWRDSNEYICVEPVSCFPEYFGKYFLSEKTMQDGFSCSYSFLKQ